eukprot:48878-Pyramimonas_sp.AAC.1
MLISTEDVLSLSAHYVALEERLSSDTTVLIHPNWIRSRLFPTTLDWNTQCIYTICNCRSDGAETRVTFMSRSAAPV